MAQQEGQNGNPDKVAAETAVVFTALKPQLRVEAPKADEAVQFYKAAFGAVETGRTTHPKRKAEQELPYIISAQLQLAGTTILVSDLADDSNPKKSVDTRILLELVTEDVEGATSKAVAAGAVKEAEIVESDGACYGGAERVVKVRDPYGFVWIISSLPKKQPNSVNVEA